MYFSTIALAALTGAAAVSAGPIERRQCLIQSPNPTAINIAANPAVAQTTTIQFAIPAGSVGPCQLEAVFPAGFPISSSGQTQVNVIDVDGPTPGSIVGTVTFADSPTQDTTLFINSFACRPTMTYTLELASWEEGAVSFQGGNGAGIVMAVGNCY